MLAASFKRTKIVATVGPATNSREAIYDLIEAGANCNRINRLSASSRNVLRYACGLFYVARKQQQPGISGIKIKSGPISNQQI